MVNNTEATLVQQVLNGRRECYRPLVEMYQKRVYVLACSMIGNNSEAQDIAQEAFLTAYKHLSDLKDRAKFGTWLYGITRNLCYTALRKKKVESESLNDVSESEYSNVISLNPLAEDGEDLLETLMARLDQLPEKYQTLLRMRYLEDYSYQEISEMLDIPVDLVRSRLFEGRKILRESVQHVRRAENDR